MVQFYAVSHYILANSPKPLATVCKRHTLKLAKADRGKLVTSRAVGRRVGRPNKTEPSAGLRAALLAKTRELIAQNGPTDVHAADVAREVGSTPAAITYNFGSWNGLVAEAARDVYVDYIEGLWAAVKQATKEPEPRLRAYVAAQLRWSTENPGWGAVFNYPFSAKSATQILQQKFGTTTRAHFELNYARLIQLTLDVRQGSVTDHNWSAGNHPREELLGDQHGLFQATMNGWTALGMMVWRSRGPTMESQIDEILEHQEKIIDWTISEMIAAIKRDRP